MSTEKNAQISALILRRVAAGQTLQQAVDSVLGAGTYARVAGEVWEAFRAAA